MNEIGPHSPHSLKDNQILEPTIIKIYPTKYGKFGQNPSKKEGIF